MSKSETVPIFTADSFDLNRLTFSHSKQKGSSFSRIYMNYDGKRFFFKTPNSRFPFGLSRSSEEIMEKYSMKEPSFTIQVTLSEWSDEHEDTEMKRYYQFLKNLEEKILTYLTDNAKDLELVSKKGKPLSRNEIENQFKDFLRQKENKEDGGMYPPQITFKMKTYEKKFSNCPAVHYGKTKTVTIDYENPEEAVPRGSHGFIVYSQCINLSNFGISLAMNPQLIRVKPVKRAMVDFSQVLEDSDEEEDVEESPAASSPVPMEQESDANSDLEEDSSSDEEMAESEATEESEPEPEPEPVKPKAKQSRKKLATPE